MSSWLSSLLFVLHLQQDKQYHSECVHGASKSIRAFTAMYSIGALKNSQLLSHFDDVLTYQEGAFEVHAASEGRTAGGRCVLSRPGTAAPPANNLERVFPSSSVPTFFTCSKPSRTFTVRHRGSGQDRGSEQHTFYC